MYFENQRKTKGRTGSHKTTCVSPLPPVPAHRLTPSRSSENQVIRPGENDQFIKQTYSVFRDDPDDPASGCGDDSQKKPRKWHLSQLSAGPRCVPYAHACSQTPTSRSSQKASCARSTTSPSSATSTCQRASSKAQSPPRAPRRATAQRAPPQPPSGLSPRSRQTTARAPRRRASPHPRAL